MKKLLLMVLAPFALLPLIGCGVNMDDYAIVIKTGNNYVVAGVIDGDDFKVAGIQKHLDELYDNLKEEGIESKISVSVTKTEETGIVFAVGTVLFNLVNKLNDNEIPIYSIKFTYTEDGNETSSSISAIKLSDVSNYNVVIVYA